MNYRKCLGAPLIALAILALLAGCQAAQKTAPHVTPGKIDIQAQFGRGDLVVLNAVEGKAKVLSVLGGLYQNIDDGAYIKILGFGIGIDRYTYFSEPSLFTQLTLGIFRPVTAEDRAYYKALEKEPEADLVLTKSMDRRETGLGFIFSTREVTFRGKAVKVTSNK